MIYIYLSTWKHRNVFDKNDKNNILKWTRWTLTKRIEKKLDDNCRRMIRAIPKNTWDKHLTKQQLYAHLHPITKTIQIRRTRRGGNGWRRKDELISDVLLWTPSHGHSSRVRPARNYQQHYLDTECSREDLPEAYEDRE